MRAPAVQAGCTKTGLGEDVVMTVARQIARAELASCTLIAARPIRLTRACVRVLNFADTAVHVPIIATMAVFIHVPS